MIGLGAVPAWVWTLRARRLRAAGRYTPQLLEAAFAAWRLHPSARNLLQWAAMRRDLGLPLSGRMAREVLAVMPRMPSSQRVRALAGVAEAFPDRVSQLPEAWRHDAARILPALGMALQPDRLHPDLAKLAAQQAAWRHDFANAVRASAAQGGVAVVGNAAKLRESSAGDAIDACGLVVRFNHHGRRPELQACVGNKIDVWVVSPAYQGPPPQGVPTWVVVTGPAMEYKLQNWSAVQPLLQQGSKLLTVPLTVWRTCVQQLQAPPSAGVLMLCWLQDLLGGRLAGVRVAGVGGHKPGQPYTTLNAQHGRTSRHDWLAEQVWLDAAGVNTQANVAAGLPEPLQSATLFATN